MPRASRLSSPSTGVGLFRFLSLLSSSSHNKSHCNKTLPLRKATYRIIYLSFYKPLPFYAISIKVYVVLFRSSSLTITPDTEIPIKSSYLYLLSENMIPAHCIGKFHNLHPSLDWPATWHSLSLFNLNRKVIDLKWKIEHGVLYTAQCLFSFGLTALLPCFSSAPVESLDHLFFSCPLAQSVLPWVQSHALLVSTRISL